MRPLPNAIPARLSQVRPSALQAAKLAAAQAEKPAVGTSESPLAGLLKPRPKLDSASSSLPPRVQIKLSNGSKISLNDALKLLATAAKPGAPAAAGAAPGRISAAAVMQSAKPTSLLTSGGAAATVLPQARPPLPMPMPMPQPNALHAGLQTQAAPPPQAPPEEPVLAMPWMGHPQQPQAAPPMAFHPGFQAPPQTAHQPHPAHQPQNPPFTGFASLFPGGPQPAFAPVLQQPQHGLQAAPGNSPWPPAEHAVGLASMLPGATTAGPAPSQAVHEAPQIWNPAGPPTPHVDPFGDKRLSSSAVPPTAKFQHNVALFAEYAGEHLQGNKTWATSVTYLNAEQRQQYKLTVKDGKIFDAEGKPFDTRNGKTACFGGGAGKAIFVMDHDGNLYASNYHAPGKFHHSSFLAGQPVAGAGEITVHNGEIQSLTRNSGHYRPSAAQLEQVAHSLSSQGLSNFVLDQKIQ
ncbi:hypothetical protein SAMN05192589_103228 [Paracidovorax valerianellae]|uniref:Uncharacterized protein n=2 Tax=Paracidovorax valerianellae TaxID=187868 RepID=A0A1G6PFA6_9BURK|nr:hypothetical protein [Paracidovorax valerianellae]SDC78932.1 hypothetical protein SAMN05192589_103228 [Paracidovorax valerianellae]